jgi:hypothetical protein
MTKFDGKGKFTPRDFVVIDGSPTSSGFAPETGTYAIHSPTVPAPPSFTIPTGHGSISSS